MVQHSKMKTRFEKLGADGIVWGKTFVRIIYHHKCNNSKRKKPHWPLQFDLPTRKTRADNFKNS